MGINRGYAVVSVLLLGLAAPAWAKLPPKTPAEVQAAAAKKAQADAQAAREKQELGVSVDYVTAQWRRRAAAMGWKVNPPVTVTPAGLTQPAAQSSASGQPGGQLGAAARQAPKPSAKAGTAPPSPSEKANMPPGIK
jgi:hypothetical protein